jgi:2-haloacid dehalogenase
LAQTATTPSDEPVRAVLLDLGGVLVEWDPRHLYRRIFADAAAMEHFLATVCTPEWNEEQDIGRPFAEGVRLLVERFPAFVEEIRAYDRRWPEMLKGPIEDSVAILGELRARAVPVFALTNWSAEKFPIARERFAFLEWFDGILVSGHVGIKKPDPLFFGLAAERFGLLPSQTAFVDDLARNVAAAAQLGFRAHHFEGASGLRRFLVDCRLLPADAARDRVQDAGRIRSRSDNARCPSRATRSS